MAFGIESTGFTLKRLEDILTEVNSGSKAIFGENLDVDPRSANGQFNGLLSGSYTDLWEGLQQAYNAWIQANSTGESLSNLATINGITRKPATSSTVELTVVGATSTFIPLGSLVSTDDGSQFSIDADVTIGIGGTEVVDATSVLTGPVQAGINTITNIDNPVVGWATVDNLAAAAIGEDEETDSELRARMIRSKEKAATAIGESILAELLDITDVDEAIYLENVSNIVDINGLDPHSVKFFVDGGADADIAEVIFNKKPFGIATNGATTEAVLDSQGISHDIKFQRPSTVVIHVEVTLVEGQAYLGEDAVKQAIVDYANGELIEGRGFGLGADVVFSEMYVPLNDTSLGIEEVTALKIDIVDPPTGVVTIDIDFDEKASFDVANIDIIVV